MSSASSLRVLALCAATFGPAFYLSGCGGGGSGPTGPTTPTATPDPIATPGPTPTPLPPGAPTPTPTPQQPTPTPANPGGGNQLLFDDFNARTLSTANWDNLNEYQPLQRTYFGNRPASLNEGGTSFTRLTLDSFNPTLGNDGNGRPIRGNYFRGTEILSKQFFTVGNGLEAEARLRAPGLPSGVVFAFFLINNRFISAPPAEANKRNDELDFEFLTAQQEQFGGRNRLFTNVWNNWNEGLYGFDGDPSNNGPERRNDDLVYQPSVDGSYDFANWNVYRIRWFSDRTEFYVNNRLERTEREVRPDQALQLRFNFWAPTFDFQQAFSGSLPGPVGSPNDPARRTYQFDVDYVRVSAIGSGAAQARIASPAETDGAAAISNRLYRTR